MRSHGLGSWNVIRSPQPMRLNYFILKNRELYVQFYVKKYHQYQNNP